MNIIEATKEARRQKVGIRNTTCKQFNVYLLPTNAVGYCVFPAGYNEDGSIKEPKPSWTPKADDIIQDDWELYNPSDGLSTEPKENNPTFEEVAKQIASAAYHVLREMGEPKTQEEREKYLQFAPQVFRMCLDMANNF